MQRSEQGAHPRRLFPATPRTGDGDPATLRSGAVDVDTNVMFRLVLIAAAATVLTGCGAATNAGHRTQVQVGRATVITPDSIGGVTIGSSKQEVERILIGGELDDGADEALTGGILQEGLDISWGRETTDVPLLVDRVTTEDPRYRTARGVGVGSSVADVKEEPGVACDAREDLCTIGTKTTRTTLGFLLRDAHVVAIGVARNE